ncbi:MAG TPA: cupredoxin domain-containing protein [Rickettsiales bacterium]|nr:cupredoxin domain-containing protein [Rickettsiales bacterium]
MTYSIVKRTVLTIAVLALSGSAAIAADQTVIQKDKSFQPAEITAKAGDTITFDNQDVITHNLYSKDAGNEFEFPKQDPGQKEKLTLKSAGKMTVHCAIHPKMKLVINVQ